MHVPGAQRETKTDPLPAPAPDHAASERRRAARDRAGTTRAYSSKDRLRARARRKTRRAATHPRSSERPLVAEQPTLRLQKISAAHVPEPADSAGGDDAMAGNDDRQPVLA